MAIPENQLETWSHLGAQVTAKSTHESVRRALNYHNWSEGTRYEVYLQGSYKNYTNIRGDSDVDIVVQLCSIWYDNLDLLSEQEKTAYKSYYSSAEYNWLNFRQDVLKALRNHYGSEYIAEGNKTLKINPSSNRLPADVIVCVEYRKYMRFTNPQDTHYIQGMKFYTYPGLQPIINYPKLHYQNSSNKSSQTGQLYRRFIRIAKNMRRKLIENGKIEKGIAPSYFLECLLYNVPNHYYSGRYDNMAQNILDYLNGCSWHNFECANEQLSLFGTNHDQWSLASAQQYICEITNLWSGWR